MGERIQDAFIGVLIATARSPPKTTGPALSKNDYIAVADVEVR